MHIGLLRKKIGKKEQVLHMDFEAKRGYGKNTIATITRQDK
jgi:hypothetical protein